MKTTKTKDAKRTERDYTLDFKLFIVEQAEKATSRINKRKVITAFNVVVTFWYCYEIGQIRLV